MSRSRAPRLVLATRWASLLLAVALYAIAVPTGLEIVTHTYETSEGPLINLSNLAGLAFLFGGSALGALILTVRLRDDYLNTVGRPAM